MGKELEEKAVRVQTKLNCAFLKLNLKLKDKELDPEVEEALQDFKVASMDVKNMLKEVLRAKREKRAAPPDCDHERV